MLEILLAKHARCVAEMTMNSASANRELHTFGEWRTDHDAYASALAEECDNLEKQMEAIAEGGEG